MIVISFKRIALTHQKQEVFIYTRQRSVIQNGTTPSNTEVFIVSFIISLYANWKFLPFDWTNQACK